MLFDIIECLICILAVYGLLALILAITESIHCRMTGSRPKVRVVLIVKDVEDQIEYIVRYAIKKEYSAKVFSDKRLVIVDMDSKDNTYVLLEKLQKNFPSIEVLNISNVDNIFKEFN